MVVVRVLLWLYELGTCPNPGFVHLGRTNRGELCCVERLNAAQSPDMSAVDVSVPPKRCFIWGTVLMSVHLTGG
jgi:hypothetical protein